MQVIYIEDLKMMVKDFKNEETFTGGLSRGIQLGRSIKRSLDSGATTKVSQYVRVPKYYCDENRAVKSSEEQDRLLILVVFWIVAFSNKTKARGRLKKLSETFGTDLEYLKFIIETFGIGHGLTLKRVMTNNGQIHQVVDFEDPRDIKAETYKNIF
ncbi:MAG: hypothetical protein ACRC0F_08020 [Cetobacterium sp.]